MTPGDAVDTLLDETLARFADGFDPEVSNGFSYRLDTLRTAHDSPADWKVTAARCLRHPLAEFFAQDPLTARSRAKPRGYAGDAGMIDLLYRERPAAAPTTDPNRLLRAVWDSPTGRTVRFRRGAVAAFVTRAVADRAGGVRVLSLAAGHMRERDLLDPEVAASVEEWVAIDQDAESLAEVGRCYGADGRTRLVEAGVADFVADPKRHGNFQVAYATGLLDYFLQPTARKITAALWHALAPGGELLVPNHLPGTFGRGYMEAFMDWWLVYRTDEQMCDLTGLIPPGGATEVELTADPDRNMAFLRVRKAEVTD